MGVENMAEFFYYEYVTIEPKTYFLTASEFGLTYVGLKLFLLSSVSILTGCSCVILKDWHHMFSS